MNSFVQFIVGVWLWGGIVSLFIFSARCGVGWNVGNAMVSAWMHVPSRRNGVPWIFLTFGKAFAWPVVLGTWLRDGCPPSPLLFNDSAVAALGHPPRDLSYAERGFAIKWSLTKDGPPLCPRPSELDLRDQLPREHRQKSVVRAGLDAFANARGDFGKREHESTKQAGSDGPSVPSNLVDCMERFGRYEIDPVRSQDNSVTIWKETQEPLVQLFLADPHALIHALAFACIPVGGFAVYGAERTVVNFLGSDSLNPEWASHPERASLLDASIAFLRSNFVPPMRVPEYAWRHFTETGGTSNTWLPLRPVPQRDAAKITPLREGEERRLMVLAPEPDANVVLVKRAGDGDLVAVIDARRSDEDPTRTQWEHKRAADLYDLYVDVAWSCQVWEWCDPELEPFFPAPKALI